VEIDIAGMKVTLEPARANVKVVLPGGGHIEKMGVEMVLLFGILAALTKPTGKTK
jgi:hypothetical protein